MKKYWILVLAAIFSLYTCERENVKQSSSLIGVWREGNQYNSFINSWDNVGYCETDDTHEFTDNGRYLFNPGTQNCGTQLSKNLPYSRNGDTVLINGTTMWVIESLSSSELVYLYRVSFGSGFVWNKHKLIR